MAQLDPPQGDARQDVSGGFTAGDANPGVGRLLAGDNLDRLTRLAARALRAPLAVFHLLHAERKLHKTWIGLPEPAASRLETMLSDAFLQHLHGSSASLIVRNALEKPFPAGPAQAMREAGIAACMCVPLLSRQGEKLGSLCVMDAAPRDWTDEDLETLVDVGATAVFEIESRQDFLEQERREDALRESEARLRVAVRATGAAVWMIDLAHGGVEYFDRRGCEMLHIDPERREWPPGTLCAHLHPEDVALMRTAFGASMSDRSDTVEYRVIRRDGEVRWLQGAGEPQCDAQGRPLRFIGVSFDITESKGAEHALRNSEERLRLALSAAHAGVWQWDIPSDTLRWSRENHELYGIPATGSGPDRERWEQAVHADDRERVRGAICDALEAREQELRVEYRVLHPARGVRWLLGIGRVQRAADGQPLSMSGINVDITERKAAEQEREQLAAIIDATTDFVGMSDRGGRVLYLNRAARRMLGLPEAADVRGMQIADCHDGAAYRVVRDVGLPAAAREGSWEGENTLLARDGRSIPVSQVILAHGDGSGYAYSTVARDLSEQKSIERALREKEAFQNAILTSAGVCVIAVDTAGKILSFNRTAERLLGYTAEEVVGRVSPLVLHLPSELAARAAQLTDELGRTIEPRQVFSARALQGEVESGEWTFVRKDGSTFPVDLAVTALRDQAGGLIGFLGIAHDLTARKAIEDALRESEAQLRMITESTEAWLARIDVHERYLFANRAFTERAGMRRRSVIGRTVREVVSERAYRVVKPELTRALAGERVLFEKLVPYYAMGERYVRIEYIPELDAHGAVRGVVEVIVDLTQRRRAEEALRESEARLATLTAAVPAMLFSTTAEGCIDYVNDTFFEYSGLSREVSVAPAWQKIVEPDDLPRVLASWDASVRTGQDLNVECRLRRADGTYRWFKGYAAQLRDERRGASKWLGVALDIDDQKKAEATLQDANRRKNEFLAMLAHELRNPLAPIRNSAHILQMLSVGEPRLKTTTEMIGRQVSHMARLIDDLLDVARITQGKITLRREPLELMPLLYNAVESVRPFIDARGHELRIEPPAAPVYLEADATRLTQVVTNLLSNATKYTDAGGRISLSVRQDGEQIVIVVRDTGIGISAELMPDLFNPFTQSDRSLDRSQGGLGIGLSLVKRLVEMHGGEVKGFSAGLGKGSTFTVRLPASSAEQATRTLPPRTLQVGTQSAVRLRVLVVDDNVDAEQSLSLLMRLQGHEVRAAHDGMEAVRQARAFGPQVVLLDIGLPGMSGYDVARRLRQAPESADAVLVAITGYGQAEDREQAMEAGFQHHLVKPVEPVALIQLIESLGGQRPKLEAR